MYITWYGQGCFKLMSKYLENDVSLLTDPHTATGTAQLARVSADIVAVTLSGEGHDNVSVIKGANEDEPFIVATPGEFESKGIFVTGMSSNKSVIYRFDVEEVSFLHLGNFQEKELTQAQLDRMGTIDVLFVPIDNKEAQSIISQVEPRVIIPMQYDLDKEGLARADIDRFAKESESTVQEVKQKWRLVKKDLPIEDTEVVFISNN